ncbi:hypothetical protein C8R44DRAFT_340062 [Mycena epipterygia]|nr:hypothetical protein C8R44DRAFT_340062 [Mycena epipterygia]
MSFPPFLRNHLCYAAPSCNASVHRRPHISSGARCRDGFRCWLKCPVLSASRTNLSNLHRPSSVALTLFRRRCRQGHSHIAQSQYSPYSSVAPIHPRSPSYCDIARTRCIFPFHNRLRYASSFFVTSTVNKDPSQATFRKATERQGLAPHVTWAPTKRVAWSLAYFHHTPASHTSAIRLATSTSALAPSSSFPIQGLPPRSAHRSVQDYVPRSTIRTLILKTRSSPSPVLFLFPPTHKNSPLAESYHGCHASQPLRSVTPLRSPRSAAPTHAD